jgi:type IV pilus assembly protein PilC
LPFTTQVLITVSDLFVNYGFVMIWLVVILIIWFMIWKRTEDGRYIFDNFKMKIPVFWDIIQKTVLSKFSRVFSWLIDSWVSIVESLKITADAVWNEVYKQRILMLSQDVALGIKIWESIDWDKLFPPMMVQMIQVWEQTAKLESTISKVADFYDEQVDNVVAALNKLLEPFIIVVLAVVVWFIALWIMQPIMDMSNTISNM